MASTASPDTDETNPSNTNCDKGEKNIILYAFVGVVMYSATMLLIFVIYVVVYRQYLRFVFRKRPVGKPGEFTTMDETMTTMGATGNTQTGYTEASTMSKAGDTKNSSTKPSKDKKK